MGCHSKALSKHPVLLVYFSGLSLGLLPGLYSHLNIWNNNQNFANIHVHIILTSATKYYSTPKILSKFTQSVSLVVYIESVSVDSCNSPLPKSVPYDTSTEGPVFADVVDPLFCTQSKSSVPSWTKLQMPESWNSQKSLAVHKNRNELYQLLIMTF